MSDYGILGKPVSGVPANTIATPWLRDAVEAFGLSARPFAIYTTAGAVAVSTILLALKVNSPEAAVFLGAAFLGVGTLYGVKGWEMVTQTRANADVQKSSNVVDQKTSNPGGGQ